MKLPRHCAPAFKADSAGPPRSDVAAGMSVRDAKAQTDHAPQRLLGFSSTLRRPLGSDLAALALSGRRLSIPVLT